MATSPALLARGLLDIANSIFKPGGPATFNDAAAVFVRMGADPATALGQVRQAVQSSFQLQNELRANGQNIVPETAYIPFPGKMAEGNNYFVNIFGTVMNTTTGEIFDPHPWTMTSSGSLAADEWNAKIDQYWADLLTDSDLELLSSSVMGGFRKTGG